MTRDEILALDGLALRAAVAEHVMGWPRVDVPSYWFRLHNGLWSVSDTPLWESSLDACLAPDGPLEMWLANAPVMERHALMDMRWYGKSGWALVDRARQQHAIFINHDGTPAGIATALCRALLIAVLT